jgi:hypothetical protein
MTTQRVFQIGAALEELLKGTVRAASPHILVFTRTKIFHFCLVLTVRLPERALQRQHVSIGFRATRRVRERSVCGSNGDAVPPRVQFSRLHRIRETTQADRCNGDVERCVKRDRGGDPFATTGLSGFVGVYGARTFRCDGSTFRLRRHPLETRLSTPICETCARVDARGSRTSGTG